MSKAFIAQVIQDSAALTGAAANRAAGDLMDAIVKELTASRDKLCGGASDCEALTALTTWASKEPPFTL